MNKMTCGHCLRQYEVMHGGGGELLCCACVHVKRAWLALERCGVNQHNKYAADALKEHADGQWCKATSERESSAIVSFALPKFSAVLEDAVLDAEIIE